MQFNFTQDIFQNYANKTPKAELEKLGLASYTDFQGWLEGATVTDGINTVFLMVNTLEALDPFLSAVTTVGSDNAVVEIYSNSSFKPSSFDVMAAGSKPTLNKILIPSEDYGDSYTISEKLLMQLGNGIAARGIDKLKLVEEIIGAIYPAYQKLLRGLALRGILTLPNSATDLKSNPGFWRNITNAGQQLTPPQNGFETFPSTESHYLYGTLDEQTLNVLSRKITSKGLGKNGIVYVAAEQTWTAYKALFAGDELERLNFMDYRVALSQSQAMDNPMPLDSTKKYTITLPSSDMPIGYIVAYDINSKFLYQKEAVDTNLRGLQAVHADFTEIRTSKSVEYKVFETGFGVVNRSAGAIFYCGTYDATSGAFTPGSAYVNPNFSAILFN